jgi:hypothetical protein
VSLIAHCEACGQPVREWNGRRNDLIGLSSMWAKRAHAVEAEVELLHQQLQGAVSAVRAHYDGWVKANGRMAGNMRPADRELWIAVLGPEFGGQ